MNLQVCKHLSYVWIYCVREFPITGLKKQNKVQVLLVIFFLSHTSHRSQESTNDADKDEEIRTINI